MCLFSCLFKGLNQKYHCTFELYALLTQRDVGLINKPTSQGGLGMLPTVEEEITKKYCSKTISQIDHNINNNKI